MASFFYGRDHLPPAPALALAFALALTLALAPALPGPDLNTICWIG
jgi:hypothetical protein